MGSIPFGGIAALANESGQIAQAPLNEYAETQRINALNAQMQGQRLQNQLQAQAIKDQGALTQALTHYDPSTMTPADMTRLVSQYGGSGKAALEAQAGMIQAKQNILNLSDAEFKRQQSQADLIQGVHDSVTKAPADQKQQVYSSGLQQLAGAGVDVSKEPQQYPGDDVFAQHLPAIRLHTAMLADAEKERQMQLQQAQTTEAQGKGAQAQAEAQAAKFKYENGAWYDISGGQPKLINGQGARPDQFNSLIDQVVPSGKNAALNARTKATVGFLLQQGKLEDAQNAVKAAGEQVGTMEKEAYVQGREDLRQALNRQAMQANELQRNGLNKLDQMFTDPQHGYTQFLAQAGATKDAITQAKNGNELAASLAPLMTVLGVNSFAGVHRVSPQEYEAAGPQVGSLYRRINSMLDKAAAGKIQPDTAKEMGNLIDGLISAKHQSLVGSAQLVARNGGLDPSKTSVLDAKGNVTTLDKIQNESAQQTAAPKAPPQGATHTGIGSVDHKRHYLNAQGQDLGVAE